MRALTLLTLMAIGASTPLMAMEHDDHHVMPTNLNSLCPMCDMGIGDKSTNVKITIGEGADAKTYLLACDSKNCADMFMKDPEAVLKKAFGKDTPGPKTQYK